MSTSDIITDGVGGFCIGALLACFLSGIISQQAINYFRIYSKKDKMIYLVMVSILWILDILHTIISCYTVYYWLVQNFSNGSVLAYSPWSFSVEPIIVGLVAAIVQIFYAYRIYILSKRSWYLPAFVSALATIQFAWALASTIQIYANNSLFSRFGTFTYGVSTWLSCASVCDLVITVSLVYYLRKAKTAFGKSNYILDSIISRAVETGMLSMTCAAINAIMFTTVKGSWYIIPQLALVKLYFNSLLVSLNSRASIANELANRSGVDDFSMAPMSPISPSSPYGKYKITNIPIHHVVTITTEIEEHEKFKPFDSNQEFVIDGSQRTIPPVPRRQAGESNWQ